MIEILLISSALVGLLCLNGLLVACQVSLVKLRYIPLNEQALQRLKRRWTVRRVMNHTHHTARVLRFSISVCTLTLGLLFFALLHGLTLFQGEKLILGALALILAICVHSLFAEAIPRRLAVKNPEKTLQCTSWVVSLFEVLTFPLHRAMRSIVAWVSRLLRLKAENNFNLLDVEVQLRALGRQSSALSPVIRQILNNALQMSGLTVQDVLLPRHQIQYFNLQDGIDVNLNLARETGHTRFPLCKGDLDKCIGIVHIKDIFRYRGDLKHLDLRKIRRKIIDLSPEDPLEKALQKLLHCL